MAFRNDAKSRHCRREARTTSSKFLAWHRAYLHYHEEIIREVTGNEAFALPYWNWLDDDALPALFQREPFTNPSRTNWLDGELVEY
jgi:polyphenol oxidase